MIRRRQLRRLLAPTAGLRASVGITLLGLILFLFGTGLSFRRILGPAIRNLSEGAEAAVGTLVPDESRAVSMHFLALAFLLLGLYFLFRGTRSFLRHLVEVLNPGLKSGGVADVYVRRLQLAQGPRIVALGGGTGLSTLLRGLKQHSSNITAIVTVTDDGGSSGVLRKEKGMIPPGDIRNCLVALADAEKAMTDLFQHRFGRNSGTLSGHSTGNLLIAALVDQSGGDFEAAVRRASDVLAIRGRVVPATLATVTLKAIVEGGDEVSGEVNIVKNGKRILRVFLDPANVEPHPEALESIRTADVICIGPGSLYTSIIPNLLVPGIAQALKESQAVKVYVCNVMTQPGESDAMTASEHVAAIVANVGTKIFDYVLLNNGEPGPDRLERYRESGQALVEPDADRVRALGFYPVVDNLMNESDFVRHDPLRVASRVISLMDKVA